jgi:hypothetical protein
MTDLPQSAKPLPVVHLLARQSAHPPALAEGHSVHIKCRDLRLGNSPQTMTEEDRDRQLKRVQHLHSQRGGRPAC